MHATYTLQLQMVFELKVIKTYFDGTFLSKSDPGHILVVYLMLPSLTRFLVSSKADQTELLCQVVRGNRGKSTNESIAHDLSHTNITTYICPTIVEEVDGVQIRQQNPDNILCRTIPFNAGPAFFSAFFDNAMTSDNHTLLLLSIFLTILFYD